MWLPLENVKMGRLHLAVTVIEANAKVPSNLLIGLINNYCITNLTTEVPKPTSVHLRASS